MKRLHLGIAVVILYAWVGIPHHEAHAGFVNFESQHIHPIAKSPDGTQIAVVNTPDARVSFFAVDAAGQLSLQFEVPVGLEPVSVAYASADRVWVVNHLSDTISIVDLAAQAVVRTVHTGDEPTDVLFTRDPRVPAPAPGGLAADAGRGSSPAVPDPQPVPLERWAWVCVSQDNRVEIFDAENPGAPLFTIPIAGSDPRTLAYDADRDAVYVAVFESGNNTALVPRTIRADPSGPWGGQLHPYQPPLDPANILPPQFMPDNGVIVKWNGTDWVDEGDGSTIGIWTPLVPWSIQDNDVVRIAVAPNPTVTATYTGVGTLLFDIAVDPRDGTVLVTNTEAHNDVLFEPKLQGVFADNRITTIDPASGIVTPSDVNAGFATPDRVSQPGQMAVRAADGMVFYTAIGGSVIGMRLAGVDVGRLPYREGGTGIVLGGDGNLLYVVNRFTNDVSVLDATNGAALQVIPIGMSGFDPTPDVVRNGRPFLYTGAQSMNHDLACATCHPFANMDNLAWDLGDPTGSIVTVTLPDSSSVAFHPLKGPMVTQTLRGLENTGRLHWRGDRTDFNAFNGAFVSLLGGPDTLSATDMQAFTDFILTVNYPPNPLVPLDNTLTGSALAGFNHFSQQMPGELFCAGCHALTNNLGTNGAILFLGGIFGNQFMKVPQLRNLYEKTKIDDALGPDPSIRSFGFLHDGHDDTIEDFVAEPVLALETPTEQADMAAYLKSFPTGTAAGVGAQWTVHAFSEPPVSVQLPVLEQQAAAGNLDLIVKGRRGGLARGFVYDPNLDAYVSDSKLDPPMTRTQLFAALLPGDALTFTGVPPTCGTRLGIDRDEDGWGDYDEVRLGSDPADPASFPQPTDTDGDPRTPQRTAIASVFPNPFNPRTEVRFTLASRDHAAVSVFGVDGRLIKRLSRSWLEAGEHVVRWNGTDTAGQPVASGVYFIALETRSARDVRKVTLAK